MKLHTAPQHAAEMNGIDHVSSFSIKATAKSFSILSSGLYANKVRAILRELGCNAYDSHVAANRKDQPWDLHLPTHLEPWFAIRDYGTGLTHEQVLNIYTTYFESTKTDSNDFVGALGLGSKSPFSYTDNFTVTAICNGRRGIYTAYINDIGIPSIALMLEEESSEPNGVEVKFAVNSAAEFSKFAYEAESVYIHFEVKPNVNIQHFKFGENSYHQQEMIPGVRRYTNTNKSYAVMGNIAYPIDVPNAETNLGDLHRLLGCGLELHFNIGDLDFQASREGLSYIPSTIKAIKDRLNELNCKLYSILQKQADAYDNGWNLALWLHQMLDDHLWKSAATQYINDNKFELISLLKSRYDRLKQWAWTTDELAEKFNVSITGFSKYRNSLVSKQVKAAKETRRDANGNLRTYEQWGFGVSNHVYFANNTTGVGAVERGRYHWANNRDKIETSDSYVYIINPADKTKPAKFAEFMKALHNPPRQCKVDDWDKKPRATSTTKNQTIKTSLLKLSASGKTYWADSTDLVWKDAGAAEDLNPNEKYYYLPLNGYILISDYGNTDAKDLASDIFFGGLGFSVNEIYGVRKPNLEWVKQQKNWINIEEHVKSTIQNPSDYMIHRVTFSLNKSISSQISQLQNVLPFIKDSDSELVKLLKSVPDGGSYRPYNAYSMQTLCRRYGIDEQETLLEKAQKRATTITKVLDQYPMLKLTPIVATAQIGIVADYINLVDKNCVNF